jgi:hypothetical protein
MHTRTITVTSRHESASRRVATAAHLFLSRASMRTVFRPWGVLLFPIGQIAALLWVIWARTAQVPYWDEWATVDVVKAWRSRALTFADVWALHDVHRVAFPRLVDLFLIQGTAWNRQVEMTFDLALAALSGGLIIWCARRTLGPHLWSWLVPLLSLLLFTFAQFGNWFAPFQLAFIATACGASICLAALINGRSLDPGGLGRRLGIAMCGALLASLSSLNGLVVWPAFLPAAWASGQSRGERWRGVTLWAAGGAAVWIAYFIGFPPYQSSPIQPGMTGLDIMRALGRYALIYLGAPLGFPDVWHAANWGLVGVCLALVVLRLAWLTRAEIHGLHAWIGLLLFVLGCLAATTTGRAISGPYQAFSSRYQAFSTLWWVALLVLGAAGSRAMWPRILEWRRHHLRESAVPIAVAALFLLAASVSLGWANITGWQAGLMWQDSLRKDQGWVAAASIAPQRCLLKFNPFPESLRPRAAYLRGQHLGLFAPGQTGSWSEHSATPSDPSCTKPYVAFIE